MSFHNASCSEYNVTHQVVQVGSEKSDSFNPLVQLLGLLCVCYFKRATKKKSLMEKQKRRKFHKSHVDAESARLPKDPWIWLVALCSVRVCLRTLCVCWMFLHAECCFLLPSYLLNKSLRSLSADGSISPWNCAHKAWECSSHATAGYLLRPLTFTILSLRTDRKLTLRMDRQIGSTQYHTARVTTRPPSCCTLSLSLRAPPWLML